MTAADELDFEWDSASDTVAAVGSGPLAVGSRSDAVEFAVAAESTLFVAPSGVVVVAAAADSVASPAPSGLEVIAITFAARVVAVEGAAAFVD